MRLMAASLGLVAALSANCAQAQRSKDWHELSFSKSERRIAGHDFEVSVDNVDHHGHPVWIAQLVDRVKGKGKQTTWADSETCPAMTPAFAKLQLLEPFKIVPPGVRDGPTVVVLDGDTYRLHAQGYWPLGDRGGQISLSSNDGPLMSWVEDTLKALAPCWRHQRFID